MTPLFSLMFFLSTPVFAADIAPVGKVKVEAAAKVQQAAESPEPDRAKQANEQKAAKSDGAVTGQNSTSQNNNSDNRSKQKAADNKTQPSSKPKKRTKLKKKLALNRSPNSFNRLLKPPSKRNPPPSKDGIHDPDNDGTHILQAPKDSFSQLTKSNSGNRVDWVAALEKGEINPRYDRLDPEKVPIVLDLNIVREVKGSMPDVVYPHKQHTEWLDCSNCHPAIFVPMKGANNISMASILLGEKCGVCHGKVAFPVSECRKCHSKNKTE